MSSSRHPFRFGYLAMAAVTSLDQLVRNARTAQDQGYSTFQVSDHFDRSPAAPLLTLAAVAAQTSDMRLGTLVLDNDFRHPAVLAKELATLDLLCGGRLEVGLGAGWMTADYEVSGIPLERAGIRIDKLAETVAIVDAVLGADRAVTIEGEHYQVRGLRSVPAPSQRPRPPLLVGGGGRRILTLAARTADVVSVNLAVGEGRIGVEAARSSAAEATDEKLGWVRSAAGDRMPALEVHLLAYWSRITDQPEREARDQIARRGLSLEPEELLASPHCLIGPLEQLVERVHELRERWQINYVTFYDAAADAMAPLVARLAGR